MHDCHVNPFLGTTPGVRHRLILGHEAIDADYMDLSSTTVRTADAGFQPDLFVQSLSSAVGVILIYDITSLESFEHITTQGYTYACMCNQYLGHDPGSKVCDYILVGNKKDILERRPEQRQVDQELAEQWAQSQGMKHIELNGFDNDAVQAVVRELIYSIRRTKRRTEQAEQEQQKHKSQTERGRGNVKEKIKQAFGKKRSEA
jgi:GTPase SAR1 family protein